MPDHEYWEDRSVDDTRPGPSGGGPAEADLARATQLREAGDLAGSLGMLQTLAVAWMRRQGRKGCHTQCVLSQLGRTLRAMGRAAEAGDLHWEVLAIRVEYYGRFHDFTQNSAGILADTLDMLNDRELAAAVRLWRRQPDNPSAADASAISRIDDRLRAALAARQACIAQQVVKLVRDYHYNETRATALY